MGIFSLRFLDRLMCTEQTVTITILVLLDDCFQKVIPYQAGFLDSMGLIYIAGLKILTPWCYSIAPWILKVIEPIAPPNHFPCMGLMGSTELVI